MERIREGRGGSPGLLWPHQAVSFMSSGGPAHPCRLSHGGIQESWTRHISDPVETQTVSNIGPSENAQLTLGSYFWLHLVFVGLLPVACSCSRRKDLCSPHLLLQWLNEVGVFLSVNWFREGFDLKKKKKKSLLKVEILSNNTAASSPKGKKCLFIFPSFFSRLIPSPQDLLKEN